MEVASAPSSAVALLVPAGGCPLVATSSGRVLSIALDAAGRRMTLTGVLDAGLPVVACCSAGDRLALCLEDEVVVFSMSTRSIEARLRSPGVGGFKCVSQLSPSTIVTGGVGGCVIWDIEDRRAVSRLSDLSVRPSSPQGTVQSVCGSVGVTTPHAV